MISKPLFIIYYLLSILYFDVKDLDGVIRDHQHSEKDLSFEVSKGENLEIIGSNGSGKTSLLKCILGLIEKKQGHITWNEKPLEESRTLFLKSCHYQGHQLALKNNFSVFQN